MAPNNKESKRTIDEVTAEEGDSTSTPPKKMKPTRANTAKASRKDVGDSAVADHESTVMEGTPTTGEVSTTPLANKIQGMVMSGTSTPMKDTGAGLQASDDDEDIVVSTVAKGVKMRKLVSDSDNESDDSSENNKVATASGLGSRTVASLTDEVADAWGFSQLTTFKAKKLADVEDGATMALRRLPRGLRYGAIGPQKDRLILDGKVLTLLLVGRIASTYVEETKAVASVHVVPLLESDLGIANKASGEYSIPPQAPTKYNTVRASCAQQKACWDSRPRESLGSRT